MKKIIDANYFQSPDLKSYLSFSKKNIVVFSDFACMEAYRGNALKSISKSLEIVSKYPNQIEILKGTREIVKLTIDNHDAILFTDKQLTDDFKTFCSCVKLATEGNNNFQQQILEHGQEASNHFEKMKDEAQYIAEGIGLLTTSFTLEHLNIIKKGKKYSPELIDKILQEIYLMTGLLFERHPDVERPSIEEGLENCYVFRYALSAYLLFLHWVSDGGPNNVKHERLRNDIVDMSYVAYATYFDGLLSNDKKMNVIFDEVNYLVRNIFIAEQMR